jgi:hypothetical protein
MYSTVKARNKSFEKRRWFDESTERRDPVLPTLGRIIRSVSPKNQIPRKIRPLGDETFCGKTMDPPGTNVLS